MPRAGHRRPSTSSKKFPADQLDCNVFFRLRTRSWDDNTYAMSKTNPSSAGRQRHHCDLRLPHADSITITLFSSRETCALPLQPPYRRMPIEISVLVTYRRGFRLSDLGPSWPFLASEQTEKDRIDSTHRIERALRQVLKIFPRLLQGIPVIRAPSRVA